MTGFMEVSQEEMYAIDGGWTTNQWITKSCAAAGFVVGGVVGYVVAGPLGAAVGAKYAPLVTVAAGLAISVGCAYVANKIASSLID